MHTIHIDRTKPLAEEPHVGHNRYHPDIEPILEVAEGEEVCFETRDALDGCIRPGATEADFAGLDRGAVHPLTGPVAVKFFHTQFLPEKPRCPGKSCNAFHQRRRRFHRRIGAPSKTGLFFSVK